jgi:hypothetical protein
MRIDGAAWRAACAAHRSGTRGRGRRCRGAGVGRQRARPWPLPVLLALLLVAALPFAHAVEPDDGPSDEPSLSRVRVLDGEVVVALEPAVFASTGMALAEVQATARPATFEAYARVVDPSPLLLARSQYAQSLATMAVQQVDMDVARQEYRRLNDLSQRGRIVSPQDLQRALGDFQRQQALVRAEQIRQANIIDTLSQQWSVELADSIVRDGGDFYRSLISREQVLLQVTLPSPRRLAPELATVEVVLPARTGNATRTAQLVSEAPSTDARIQGETWYFVLPGSGVRTGMQLTALIGDPGERDQGVLVPESAVVWHEGRPWAYLALGDGLFARRPLQSGVEVDGGWFLAAGRGGGLAAGDQVVAAGATTLLSEEFRWQIPEEDDDDD